MNQSGNSWWQKFLKSITSEIDPIYASFKLRDKALIISLFLIGSLALISAIGFSLEKYTVRIASHGGKLTEGLIGSPRFINPVLAISEADRDLTSLIYSGLMRLDEKGKLIPDLAESYTISDDGLTYTFTLKDNLTWHDGKQLTARDVVFTILKTKDGNTRSTKRVNWEGVEVKQIDEKTIVFQLAKAYAPFLENTTIGILPTHLWNNVNIEAFSLNNLNIEPIGSGPFKIKKIENDPSGVPLYYDLVPFSDFALGKPNLAKIRVRFYPNEDELIKAFNQSEVDAIHSITPTKILEIKRERGLEIKTTPLPRTFGVFFNQNQASLFTNHEVREALSLAIDRERIIKEVLNGFGIPANNPFLLPNESTPVFDYKTNLEKAKELLATNGWVNKDGLGLTKTKNKESITLNFNLATADTPELKLVGEIIKENWEALGVNVELKVFETGNLNQTIIRPRKYDALLFGMVNNRQPDPFSFWHSSQRLDPGLNIALYANITADKLLEDIRTTIDDEERLTKTKLFLGEINKDRPATFIYHPEFIYIQPTKIKNSTLGPISDSAERFSQIYRWYTKTERVWKIFSTNRQIINE